MPAAPLAVRLIFPHQLFIDHLQATKATQMILIEDDLFFTQYKFHKQKLLLHRASMREFADKLTAAGYQVDYLATAKTASMDQLKTLLTKLTPSQLSYYELSDDWLQQHLELVLQALSISAQRLVTPAFLTSPGQIEDYFASNPNRMQKFYEWQRKRLGILLDNGKPVGGKWSFDTANRKKLPKTITLPSAYAPVDSKHLAAAKSWVQTDFAANPGNIDHFGYPLTHRQAADQLRQFIAERLDTFGPYEDAIAKDESQLFHSALSPALNIGLLTPQQVIDEVLSYNAEHQVPIASLEGFIRQVIGWREYMRATYLQYGRKMRTSNYLQFTKCLKAGWWDGSVGIEPIDTVVKRVLDTGYAHHIERLMILGNSMVLLRIKPDEVYEWFMSLFIDAYDWVMVPNVYAMSQFAVGAFITTKPYISGSNYLLKMSDFSAGNWTEDWDGLYWQFIADHQQIIKQNYRLSMVTHLYDRLPDDKKQQHRQATSKWL